MMSRIRTRCKELNAQGKGLLMAYLMAGDPDLARSREYARAVISGGVDLLELGIPFSDPWADEEIFQVAGARALRAGVTPPAIFELVKDLRRETATPIVLSTYYNPVLSMGEEIFLKRALEAGVDGVIVSDLPVEDASSFIASARRHRIDTIFLITPQTSDERLKTIAGATTGFLCITSHDEVLSTPASANAGLETLIRRIRALIPVDLPIVIEAGSTDPVQIDAVVHAGAQGIIAGSALAERIAAGISSEQLREFVQTLKVGTRPRLPVPTPTQQGEMVIHQQSATGDGTPRLGT